MSPVNAPCPPTFIARAHAALDVLEEEKRVAAEAVAKLRAERERMPTANAETPHAACVCADYTRTMHLGEAWCIRFGGMAAHCAVCGGCKACRLYDEGALPEGAKRGQPQEVSHE